ncbi:PAS domain S-box protein [Caldithrix abyssi]|nr:PAS domain S-box protein [Caldithrix abyssi]
MKTQFSLFYQFCELTKQGLCMATLEGEITYVNSALCTLLGESDPKNILGKSFIDYYPKKSRQQLKNEIMPSVIQGHPWVGQLAHISKNGVIIPTMENFFAVTNDEGHPEYFVYVIVEISDQKQVEQDIQKAKETLELKVQERTDKLEKELITRKQKEADLTQLNVLISALNRIAIKIETESTPQEVMETLGVELRKLGMICFVAFSDPDGQAFEVHFTSFESKAVTMAEKLIGLKLIGLRIPKKNMGHYTELVEEGRPVYWKDIMPFVFKILPGFPRLLVKKAVGYIGIKSSTSAVFFPMMIKKKIIGIFGISGSNIKERDIEHFSLFSNQVATAIHDARLYDHAQQEIEKRKRIQQTLHQRTDDLSLINTIINMINRGEDFANVVKNLSKETQRLFACYGATIYLFNEDNQYLELNTNLLPSSLVKRIENINGGKIPESIKVLMKADSHFMKAWESDKPYVINDFNNICDLVTEHIPNEIANKLIPNFIQSININSIMIHRLVLGEEKIGFWVMALKNSFSNSDLDRIRMISAQVMGAIKHKLNEEARHKSETRYRTLFEECQDPICMVNPENEFIDVNQATMDLFGYTKEELLDIKPRSLWANAIERKNFKKELSENGFVKNCEVKLLKKDRTEIDCLINAAEHHNFERTKTAHQIVFRDITEEKRVRRKVDRLANFPRESPHPMVELNASGNVTYINAAGRRFLDRLEVGLDGIDKLLPPHYKKLVQESLHTVKNIPPEEVTLGDSVLLWTGHPLKETQSVNFYATDITDLKKMQQNLLEAKEQAEISDRLKTIFLSTMSHEVRTPLTTIQGYTEVLYDELQNNITTDHKSFFETIRASSHRLKKLMDDILDISLIEADKTVLAYETVCGDELVKRSVGELIMEAKNKKLEMIEEYNAPGVYIGVDRHRFIQVISNILQNAIRFTSKGSITVNTQRFNDEYRIYVTDTGIGIKREFNAHLFTLFRQREEGYSRGHEGAGIGLAISRRLVSAMGGWIDVESKEGKGSTFILIFPIDKKEKAEILVSPQKVETRKNISISAAKEMFKDKVILVLEDNKANLDYILYLLSKLGIKAIPSQTGEEALTLLKDKTVDAMLIDVSMERGMSGIEFLKRVEGLKQLRNIPKIVVTAHTMAGAEKAFLSKGFDDYLPKPFKIRELVDLLQKNLSLKSNNKN